MAKETPNRLRGYLNEKYRLFHSTDRMDMDFAVHAHPFHKLVFCLSGHVTYILEGTVYDLSPFDVLLIPQGQLHRSILYSDAPYERYILWIQPSFIDSFGEEALTGLFSSVRFTAAAPGARAEMLRQLSSVLYYWQSDIPGHMLLSQSYLIQLLFSLQTETPHRSESMHTDRRLNEILQYICNHPADDLSADALSARFFISPSYLMHSFKTYTGCTVHAYIIKKRLAEAVSLIECGENASAAAEKSGFSDYSAFAKAFRKEYGTSPGRLRAESSK